MLTCLTIGTFDTFHIGHERLLARCLALADRLIVGINADQSPALNGKRLRDPQSIRWQSVADYLKESQHPEILVQYSVDRGRLLVNYWKPDVIVVGSDWADRNFPRQLECTQQELDEWDVSVLYIPRTPGVSSTALRASESLATAPYSLWNPSQVLGDPSPRD